MADPVPGEIQQPVAQPPQTPASQPAPQAPAGAQPSVIPLPQDTREKTREQFEKLLESNKRLFESNESLRKELIQRQQANQTFAPIQQTPAAPRQAVNPADFVEVDPITGESYINESKLRSKMDEIQQRASRAEQAIQSYIKTSEDREIERQSKETYSAYPELNPTNQEKFDKGFNQQVRGVLIDSMYNAEDYGGKPLSFKEAADFVTALSGKTQKSKETPSAEDEKKKQKAEEGKDLKAQGSAQVQSQPQNVPQPTFDEELIGLRELTRKGSTEALAKRLLHTEHIVPKEGTKT